MVERARSLGAALCGAALFAGRPAQAPCYPYSPAVVTLQGALRGRSHQGSRDPARLGPGGRNELEVDSSLVLVLPTPICVAPSSASPDPDQRVESGVRELRLAIGNDSVWAELATARGTRLRVTGELFRAPAGRPRPAIVVWVLGIAAAE